MNISWTLVFGILFAGSGQASSWSDLWYRRDQQAQHALQAGDSKRAAELFADPRHQAYAQLQSEQYAAAAKRLEPFADADSQYNRGNALAKSGDLQGALNAYDGALKHADLESSLRRDAQHNRDLVARQLQAQKDQQRSSSGPQPPPKGKEDGTPQGNKDGKTQGDGDGKPQGDGDGKPQGNGDGKPQGNEDGTPQGNEDGKRQGNGDGKPQGNESKDASGASRSSSPPATAGSASPSQGESNKPDGSKQSGSPPTTPSSPSSPSQAKAGDEQRQGDGTSQSSQDRNASSPEASQQQAAGQQANAGRQEPSPGSASRSGTEQLDSRRAATGDAVLPPTEQQLALEQWLRQIPDDPGGLLRRKFLIEHLMKQQQVQP
jgi:Ca-activated chloride channel family protein